jgi:hypothetical protein
MEIHPAKGIVLSAESAGRATEAAALAPGDRLRARVVEVLSADRALVDFGRFRAVAELAFRVAAGEEFAVRVGETRGRLELAVVPPPGGDAGAPAAPPPGPSPAAAVYERLRDLLATVGGRLAAAPEGGGPAAALAQVVGRLAALMEPLRPQEGAAALAERLRSLCERSGLFFEKELEQALRPGGGGAAAGGAGHPAEAGGQDPVRVVLSRDFKPHLAALRQLLEAGATAGHPGVRAHEAAALAKSAAETLAGITRQQELIAARREDPDPFQVLHFNLPPAEGMRRAALKIGYPKMRARRAGRGFRAALLLDLDRIGPARVDLLQVDRDLRIAFFVARREVREAIAAGIAELKTRLAPMFDSVAVSASVSERRIARFDEEDCLPAEGRRLDVRA